jgi:hypothetical protein
MSDAPTTPDPIEMAMEAEAAGHAPRGIAVEFLIEQKRLTRWQVANERAAFTLRVLTGLAGIAAAAVLGAMLWTASQSATLVVDSFSVPPDLATQGMTGQVAASRILDGMTAIQAKIDSQRAPSSFSRAWDGGIQVAIPSTGITFGELMRELRGWLGHDRHVSGEIVHTPNGLSLTVRLGGDAGRTFEGSAGELPVLLARGAEGAYAVAEPYRWANQLRSQGRFAEAEPLFRSMAANGSVSDRAWALLGLGNIARDVSGDRVALRYFAAAARTNPRLLTPPSNLGYGLTALGHPEAARAWLRIARRNANSGGGVRPDMLAAARARTEGQYAAVLGDLLAAERIQRQGMARGPQGANISVAARVAIAQLGLHDIRAARATMAAPDPSQTRNLGTILFERDLAAARIAAATGAWAEAVRLSDVSALRSQYSGISDAVACLLEPLGAYAMARAGEIGGAEARVGKTPLDCYDGVIFRGRIAELAGNRAHADHWFGQAVKMAPSIAFAHQAWAEAKLARGDLEGAAAEAAAAAELAPRFADPRETQGEVLLAQRDARRAAARFAEAAQLAPRWGRLRLKWGEALAARGDRAAAQAQWRWATTMDLTSAERAELDSLPVWGGTDRGAVRVGKSDPPPTSAIGVTPPHPAPLRGAVPPQTGRER